MDGKKIVSDAVFDQIFNEKKAEINEQLEKEVLIALIGDVNAGKSSTINQLMGAEVAEVGARPGETVKIKKYNYKEKSYLSTHQG